MRGDTDHTHLVPAGPESLRSQGRRLTKQRQLIWEALVAQPDAHLAADDLVERVQAELPRTSASTIYRTLDLLVDEGLVARADLGADRAYYEPATEHTHHHLVCERCGAVTHIHDDALGNLRSTVERSAGYKVGARPITFYGTCPTCRLP
jgi:Fur family ferric uptake transcriptional regulator